MKSLPCFWIRWMEIAWKLMQRHPTIWLTRIDLNCQSRARRLVSPEPKTGSEDQKAIIRVFCETAQSLISPSWESRGPGHAEVVLLASSDCSDLFLHNRLHHFGYSWKLTKSDETQRQIDAIPKQASLMPSAQVLCAMHSWILAPGLNQWPVASRPEFAKLLDFWHKHSSWIRIHADQLAWSCTKIRNAHSLIQFRVHEVTSKQVQGLEMRPRFA